MYFPGFLGCCELGRAGCGRGSSTEEHRLPVVPDPDGVQVQPQTADHGHTPAELPERVVGPPSLYHAYEVS